MGNWDGYKREEAKSRLQPGAYRVEIVSAEEKVSKSGKPMIVVGVKPNGSGLVIRDFFVSGEYFNSKASRFFDAFPQIGDGNFNFVEWVGCVGACQLKQEGEYLAVHYYLTPQQAEKLPAWVGEMPEQQKVSSIAEMQEVEMADDDMLF